MAAYRDKRRTSIAWKHFEIKDEQNGLATCKLCQQTFSYRTSVSNLMKHLKKKHVYVKMEAEEEFTDKGESETSENETPDLDKEKNGLWDYFELKDKEMCQAECMLCQVTLSYKPVDNLIAHLESHDVNLEDNFEEIELLAEKNTLQTKRNNYSVAWDYFKILDEDMKVACCRVCAAQCSYKSSVSNLMKHAIRKHGADSSQRSIIWLYFNRNGKKKAQCVICSKMLSYSTTISNLKKHLCRKHPNVKIPPKEDGQQRILVSTNGDLYEVETSEDIRNISDDAEDSLAHTDLDAVYLEDLDTDTMDEKPVKKPKPIPKPVIPVDDSSSDDEITFFNKYAKKHSDSFEHFGKYIASMLRQMPKNVSNKLQTDFVSQIMNAQSQSDLGKDSHGNVSEEK